VGFPRYRARTRWHSFTFIEYGNGARLDNGFLVLSKIGRIAVRWSRPIEGAPKTVTVSKEADGWYVAISCADVPTQPLPATGQETGIDLGLEAFATLSNGTRSFLPGWYRKAERTLKTAQRRQRSAGLRAARRGATGARKPWRCSPGRIRRCAASDRTFTIRRRWRWYARTTRFITRICRSAIWSGTTTLPRASVMQVGRRSLLSSLTRQHAPVGE
jgi:hypothetical protein